MAKIPDPIPVHIQWFCPSCKRKHGAVVESVMAHTGALFAAKLDLGTADLRCVRPPVEPTGLGAVVEAAMERHVRESWVREPWGGWVNKDGQRCNWGELIDPTVLSEGWTQVECYSDHNEDIRVKGDCDYCQGTVMQ